MYHCGKRKLQKNEEAKLPEDWTLSNADWRQFGIMIQGILNPSTEYHNMDLSCIENGYERER